MFVLLPLQTIIPENSSNRLQGSSLALYAEFTRPSLRCRTKSELSSCTMNVRRAGNPSAFTLTLSVRADAAMHHGSTCGPLSWDANLANDAQQWAQHLADTDTFEHSGMGNEGENLFEAFPSATFTTATQAWCNEISSYNGQNIPDGNFGSYGHYTQVVWPTTTAVGMGAAKSASGKVYVVGRYNPPGNFNGRSAWGPSSNAGQGGGRPPPQHTDGVYLVNSFNGTRSSSGFAWYSNIGSRQPGQRPDAYIDIQNTGVVTWEGGNFQGKLFAVLLCVTVPLTYQPSGIFVDGNVFKASVDGNAATKPKNVQVGNASNNSRSFKIFHGDLGDIYSIDGWNVVDIYQCI